MLRLRGEMSRATTRGPSGPSRVATRGAGRVGVLPLPSAPPYQITLANVVIAANP